MKKFYIAASSIALLWGCSERTADADGDGKITTEEVATAVDSIALMPGQWEAKSEVSNAKAEGGPGGNMAAMMNGKKSTIINCLTEEQAKNPGAEFLAGKDAANCEYKKFSMMGGKLDAEMVCKGPAMPGQMTMEMDGDYGPSSYSMTLKTSAEGLPGGMTMSFTTKVDGRHIGECPA